MYINRYTSITVFECIRLEIKVAQTHTITSYRDSETQEDGRAWVEISLCPIKKRICEGI